MSLLYNIAIYLVGFLLKIIAFFNKKINLFVSGRTTVFKELASKISSTDRVVWFHCASLGEFEQGRPIIESFKSQYPDHKILVTFFSPSGYEIRKDYACADIVTYLPLDTEVNAKKFIEMAHPELAVFVKYEFWPNVLKELKSKNIETILVSGIFRKDQAFFKWYGAWMQKSLKTFNYFFVQNNNSKELLESIGFKNANVCGDTRFDRVFEITKQDNQIGFIENFIAQKNTLVAGSTWKKDEELLLDYINNHATENEKFIIAPHNINENDIRDLKNSLSKKTFIFSDTKTQNTENAQVLIIDSIGLLTKIYSYANIAYVGGGFGAGIHNILEPATFGVPILIGPNYQKFIEAKELIQLDACKVINNNNEFNSALTSLFNNHTDRNNKGNKAKDYIVNNTGATRQIMMYITKTISH
jgi:3-deoxy-D-manno-octulosonic-acid transferase